MTLLGDALMETAKMAPLLYAIYVAIELLEYRWGKRIRERLQRSGSAGPAIGAVAGAIPQCGFSVVAAALYAQGLLTTGTLMAVLISTSDEAIPVILSHRDKLGIVLPIVGTKICLALLVGYGVDLIQRQRRRVVLQHASAAEEGNCPHDHRISEDACCGHKVGNGRKPMDLIAHPLVHVVKISAFIFVVTFAAGYAFSHIGIDQMRTLFLEKSVFQPFVTALIGMIPNCAVSVAIAEMYLRGAISYGSTISGLASGCGLASLVLWRENQSRRDTLAILACLLLCSTTAGVVIQYFFG
jgi:hypothetical protein